MVTAVEPRAQDFAPAMVRLNALPSTLLAMIMARLPYESLLLVTGVCRRWRELVASQEELQALLFRKSRLTDSAVVRHCDLSSSPSHASAVQLHPILWPSRIHYIIGSSPNSAQIIAFHSRPAWSTRLVRCPIACDFVTQPPYTSVQIQAQDFLPIIVEASDSSGVRVKDIFFALQGRRLERRLSSSKKLAKETAFHNLVQRSSCRTLFFAGMSILHHDPNDLILQLAVFPGSQL
ncbi:hypothetical protein BKA62DRAFT_828392 [Auriculariales sp. MPI-PUGE-AT-0066]|nr:hypothetical protein BKA62DRAFT_828392 [Auriculariales sp. MPI-PUGE-AT-0066]